LQLYKPLFILNRGFVGSFGYSFFFFVYLLHKPYKEEGRQNSHESIHTDEIEPNSVKAKAPECAEKHGGKYKGRRHRHHRCLTGLFYRAEIALCGHAEPAGQIRKAEKSYGRGRDLKQSYILGFDKQRGYGFGEEEQYRRRHEANYGRADISAFGDLLYSAVIPRSPVISKCGRERIGDTVKERPTQVACVHQYRIHCDGRLTSALSEGLYAESHQRDIHKYRGDTSRHVAEKNRRAAGGDLLEHREAEFRPCKFQKRLFHYKRQHCRGRAGTHRERRSQGRAHNVHFAHKQKEGEKSQRQQVGDDIYDHTRLYEAADPEIIVHRKEDGRKRAAQSHSAHISYRRIKKQVVRAHKARQWLGGEKHNASHYHRYTEDHNDRAGEHVVCRLMVLFAESDGYGCRCADAYKIGKRKIYHNEGHRDIYRRKRALTESLSNKNALYDAVYRHGEHTDHSGGRHNKKQPPRAHRGIHFFGFHFGFLFHFCQGSSGEMIL